jgi:hypothetical protein
MTHLGAASFGIAVTAAVLGVYIGRPAAVAPAASVERQAPVIAEGKSDRLPLPTPAVAELPVEAPQPKPVAIEHIEPAAPTPSTNRRASNCRDDCKRPGAEPDPVCGPRGRTWYTKANGWRYWRCNR